MIPRILLFALGVTIFQVFAFYCHGQTPDLIRLEQELLKLKRIAHSPADQVKKSVVELDVLVSNIVFRLISQRLQLADIRNLTADVIEWEEWPKDITMARAQLLFASKSRLCVYYRSIQTARSGVLHCFANSFLVAGSPNRIIPQVYTLYETGAGSIHSATVPNLVADYVGVETPPVFLGSIDYERRMPSLLFLAGPHGRGSFVRCFVYVLREEQNAWMGKKIAEHSPVVDYAYAERDYELLFKIKVSSDSRSAPREIRFAVPRSFQALTNHAGAFSEQ